MLRKVMIAKASYELFHRYCIGDHIITKPSAARRPLAVRPHMHYNAVSGNTI